MKIYYFIFVYSNKNLTFESQNALSTLNYPEGLESVTDKSR